MPVLSLSVSITSFLSWVGERPGYPFSAINLLSGHIGGLDSAIIPKNHEHKQLLNDVLAELTSDG
ncbi:hypothetical protein GCM10011247_18830 [Pseudomonas plecoglossicida]|nr:hypothetical protein GCM10011247_18830 [Pseudomonas plecoglossicida]